MVAPSILSTQTREEVESHLKNFVPEEIVVRNGSSWKCPTYVQRMPPCRDSCPSSEDIRGYLTTIAQADMLRKSSEEVLDQAWEILTDKNPLPAVHGRICPHPCETGCNRQHLPDGSVAINNMERFVGDHGLRRKLKFKKITDKVQSKKIAVIGSGPSGLSCAYQLARRGYPVTIFEAFEKAGGMLRYGIPSYRLPEDVLDGEIQAILDLGVELRCNTRVGRDISFEQLRKEYDAVYIAAGAHKGVALGVEGENSANVFTGASFLNRVNTGAKVEIGRRVVVIGGGDSAVDAARVSLRLNNALEAAEAKHDPDAIADAQHAIEQEAEGVDTVADKTMFDAARASKRSSRYSEVTILYRRTREEMPAITKDVVEAEHEGIRFEFLAAPVGFVTEGGRATAIKCIRMELGPKDKSGRRSPVPIAGSEFTLPVDTVIVGIGQQPELVEGMEELANKWGWVDANATHCTKVAGIFAGGDVLGLGISTRSVGHGRIAARAINAYLTGENYQLPYRGKPVRIEEMRPSYYKPLARNEEEHIDLEVASKDFSEIFKTLSTSQALAEAKRCMSCGLCFVCDQCRIYCPREAIHRDLKRPKGRIMFTDYTRCNGCHVCQQACPCGYIQMGMGF
ncbi:MAG: FAD-dependent oxidoreductase [Magnetococcales bacterium]|nr:FAD-dependent oxidoreductase [Magnetococcales bacterium]MBF0307984.1 FAD-dependent oxidoreductase [Magnetococcales bacterium]